MADELDRKLMPGFVQMTFAISLGATYKSFEMMKSPFETAGKMMSEIRSLLSIPPDAGEGLVNQSQALAAVWMEKGAGFIQECRVAGEKFTEGK